MQSLETRQSLLTMRGPRVHLWVESVSEHLTSDESTHNPRGEASNCYNTHFSCVLLALHLEIIYPSFKPPISLPANTQMGQFAHLFLESPLFPKNHNVKYVYHYMLSMIFDLMCDPMEGLTGDMTGREYYKSRGFPPPYHLLLIFDFFRGWTAPLVAKF